MLIYTTYLRNPFSLELVSSLFSARWFGRPVSLSTCWLVSSFSAYFFCLYSASNCLVKSINMTFAPMIFPSLRIGEAYMLSWYSKLYPLSSSFVITTS